jgi:hypothetical protein
MVREMEEIGARSERMIELAIELASSCLEDTHPLIAD